MIQTIYLTFSTRLKLDGINYTFKYTKPDIMLDI